MYKLSDYVVYGSTGVCQITDITKEDYFGTENEYYVLRPVYNHSMTIKTPLNNQSVVMRPVLTKDEVLSIIATMPEKETLLISSDKDRSSIFKTALKTANNDEIIKVIKTLYLEKEEKSLTNKKLTKVDDDIMKNAERLLNEEFAIALNISPDEVTQYILDTIERLGKNDK